MTSLKVQTTPRQLFSQAARMETAFCRVGGMAVCWNSVCIPKFCCWIISPPVLVIHLQCCLLIQFLLTSVQSPAILSSKVLVRKNHTSALFWFGLKFLFYFISLIFFSLPWECRNLWLYIRTKPKIHSAPLPPRRGFERMKAPG